MRLALAVVVLSSVAFHVRVDAHHSHAQYESAYTDMTGVVKEVRHLLPHSFIYLEVKEPGKEPQVWAIEGTARTQLEKMGVTKDYVKPGDTIKVRCFVLRDGSPGCLLGYVKARDGSVKDWDGSSAPPPANF